MGLAKGANEQQRGRTVRCARAVRKVQGGGLWHFNLAWEISRFKLTAKFPTRNSGFSANF